MAVQENFDAKIKKMLCGHIHTEGLRSWLIPIFWSRDCGALGVNMTAESRFIESPVASATSSSLGSLPFSLNNCFLASFTL